MKITTLAPALALAALSLAACTPKADTANSAASDTLTLNEEGDAALDNGGEGAADNAIAADDGADGNALAPATSNAL